MWNYLFSFLGGLDWVTLFSFFVVATFAFLAPRLGYTSNPSLFKNTLYLLVGAILLGFLSVRFMPESPEYGDGTPAMLSILVWGKAGLQVIALLLLVRDLMSLQPGNAQTEPGGETARAKPAAEAETFPTEPIDPQP